MMRVYIHMLHKLCLITRSERSTWTGTHAPELCKPPQKLLLLVPAGGLLLPLAPRGRLPQHVAAAVHEQPRRGQRLGVGREG